MAQHEQVNVFRTFTRFQSPAEPVDEPAHLPRLLICHFCQAGDVPLRLNHQIAEINVFERAVRRKGVSGVDEIIFINDAAGGRYLVAMFLADEAI